MVNGKNQQSREADIQFDPVARSLEERALSNPKPGDDSYEARSASLRTQEDEGNEQPHYQPSPSQPPKKGTTLHRLRKNISGIMVLLAVVGGGAAVTTITTTPAFGAQYILKSFKNFDYQTSGSTRVLSRLTNNQFKDSNVDCKGVKSCETLTSVSDQEAKTYKEAGIDTERDPKTSRIIKMDYTDPSTGEKFTARNPTELSQVSARSANFDGAMKLDARNAGAITKIDSLSDRILKKNGASKAPLDGKDEKSLKESFDNRAAGKTSSLSTNLKPVTDKDGKTIGYTDPKGTFVSNEEVERSRGSAARVDEAGKIGSRTMLDSMSKGVTRSLNILSVPSTICQVKSTLRAVEIANEVAKSPQLIRIMALAGSIIGEMEASNNIINRDTSVLDKKMELLGNLLMEVVDKNETIADPNSDPKNPRFIKNPNYGKTGYDSDVLAMTAHGFVGKFNQRTQRFTFSNGIGGGVLKPVENMLDNVDPRACKVLNNPIVQAGLIGAGVVSGAITLGGSTAITTGASLAFAFAEPLILSTLAETANGKLTEKIVGSDFVDAWGIGTQSYQTKVARARGFSPLNKSQAASYLAEAKTIEAEYARLETHRASKTPFDINNQYSFLGSLVRSPFPYMQTSSRSLGMMALNLSGLFSAASSSFITNTAHASDHVSEERFTQCQLKKYKEAGIDPDMTCIPAYGLSPEAMKLDPAENSLWMKDTNNIDPNSTTGAPKDNGQPWNYKKYVETCIDGKYDSEDDRWLTDCPTNPGAKNKALNDRFSAFTLAMSLKTATSEDPSKKSVASNNGSSTNKMSSDGWVFPTTLEADITSGFGPRGGEQHNGIDLAQPGGAMDKPIYAARAGKVVAAGPASGFGNWIVIDHGNGLHTLYGHMKSIDQGGITVQVGQEVRAGDPIGKIGNEGQSTGPHLHFAKWEGGDLLKLQGKFVDPTGDITKAKNEAKV